MLIKHKHINESFEYDGSQINPFWAFESLNIKGSSIISWIGSMNIKNDNLKDFEDIGLDIKSNKMVHFIVEFFDVQPANIEIAYLRQRLLVMIFGEELYKNNISFTREGDDIYINGDKLSVSIASASVSSMKIHFALNLYSEGTPDDIETIGLFEIKDSNDNYLFNEENIFNLINNVANDYILELNSIKEDICKTDML
ncbi:MAG: DUF366 family protein [Methanobacteriaceae archaeon]|jgi:hypothetical protein|nr:DUF366 family protein [Methanobacteriaceae archaeon]